MIVRRGAKPKEPSIQTVILEFFEENKRKRAKRRARSIEQVREVETK